MNERNKTAGKRAQRPFVFYTEKWTRLCVRFIVDSPVIISATESFG